MKTVLAITSVHRRVILEISLMAPTLCALMRPRTDFEQRWYEKSRSAFFRGFSHQDCQGAKAKRAATEKAAGNVSRAISPHRRQHVLRLWSAAPGRLKRSPAQASLRTERKSLPSHGSGFSKINLCRGDPTMRFVFTTNTLGCYLIVPGSKCTGFSNRISFNTRGLPNRTPTAQSPSLKQF